MKTIQKTTKSLLATLAACSAILAFGLNSAQAYPIVWDTPQNTTADTDVVATEGTLVRAVAGSPSSGVTVNGVVFTSYATTQSDPFVQNSGWGGNTCYNTLTWGTGTGAGLWTDRLAITTPHGAGGNSWGMWYTDHSYGTISGLSGEYTSILNGSRNGDVADTMTLDGLTTGQSYLVQLWTCDARGDVGVRTQTLDGNASTAMTTGRYAGDPGQYIVGRFVAAGPQQTITLTGAVVLNAYQLRTIDALPTAPVVAITGPAAAAEGLTYTISATAFDYDGTIAKVEFYDGVDLLATATTAPYTTAVTLTGTGPHSLTAKAYDNLDNSTSSTALSVNVFVNASMSWGAIQMVTGNTDVLAPATSVSKYAYHWGPTAADATVNGVTFTGSSALSGGTDVSLNFRTGGYVGGCARPYLPTGISDEYYSVLSGIVYDYNPAPAGTGSMIVTLNNLTIGKQYDVQMFTQVPGYGGPNWWYVVYDGSGVLQLSTYNDPGVGHYAVGRFTATAATQAISVNGAYGLWYTPVNALQLREIPVGSPSVAITKPTASPPPVAPNFTINATASDLGEGTVTSVTFLIDDVQIGDPVTSPPYSIVMLGATEGVHALTAKAIDNETNETTSAPVSITVTATDNLPVATLTSPTASASFIQGVDIPLAATATDDGGVASVAFYYNTGGSDVLIGAGVLTAPDTYTLTWSGAPVGSHVVKAVALDVGGQPSAASSVTIAVTGNLAPVVTLDSPADAASFVKGPDILLAATATDDVAVASVEFYDGLTLLGTDTTAPYAFSWSGATAGSHAVKAVAYDGPGLNTASSVATITVYAPFAIAWGTAQNTTADTDVVATEGTLVRAVAGSPTTGATVNDVVFTPYASTMGGPFTNNYPYSCYNTATWGTGTGTGLWTDSLAQISPGVNGSSTWGVFHNSTSYGTISGLSSVYTSILYGSRSGDAADTMTLGGLATGQSYLVQLWTCDARGNVGVRTQTLDGNASTAMTTGRYAGDPGQYIVGRFVAAGPQQTITLTGAVVLNAYQLRTIDPLPTVPVVAITSPADAAAVLTTFTITATAADYNGTIASVTFSYSDDAGVTWHELGLGTGLPYSYTWSDAPAGAYQLKAVAVDNAANSTTSDVINVKVGDTPPTVAITSPAAAALVPPDFIIRATATDDGAITRVEFYDDDGVTLLGTAYSSPYTCMVTGAGLGTHMLTAKAFDNGVNSTISDPVTVTVVTPVAITWDTAQKIKNIYECGDPPNYYDAAHVAVSEAEISLEGTLVRAVACGTATGSVTVNTVAFEYTLKTGVDAYNSGNGYDPHYKGWTTGVDTFYSNVASDWGIGQNGPTTYNPYNACSSPAYTTLLGGGMGASNNTVPLTLTLGNLTPGQSYLVQLWCNDSRWGSHSLQTVDGGPTMDRCVDPWVAGLGQYLIGRFTAAGTSQTISILGGPELINAYQLRAISGAPVTTTTVVSTTGIPSTVGDSVTLTATVAPLPTTGGTVLFFDNGSLTPIDVAAGVNPSTGIATLVTTALTVGSHTITASYSGATGFDPSADTTGANQTVLSKYQAWALAKGLDSGNNGATQDPDGDGVPNFIECAFNGNPKNAASTGMVYSSTEASATYGGQKVLVLTIAVRAGTADPHWTNNTATIDGLTYTIEGGTTLGDFSSDVSRVEPFDNNTGPTDLTGTGYEWRRFMLTGSASLYTKGFLRAKVEQN